MNKSFLSLGYRTDFNTQTIILTKKFAKSASVVGSKDYTILCRLRKDYPDYSIVVREIAKKEGKVNPNRNLTYMTALASISMFKDTMMSLRWSLLLSFLIAPSSVGW